MKPSKFMKHPILLLLLLTAALLLSACGGVPAETPDDEEEDAAVTEQIPQYDGEEWTVISEGGKSQYQIVRDDYAKPGEDTAAPIALGKTLSEYGIKLTTDFVKRGQETPTDTCEILVGYTNRAETAEAAEGLHNRDYTILCRGNRVAIIGGSNEATMNAVDCFVQYLLKIEDGVVSVPSDYTFRYTYVYPIPRLTLLGKDIGAYHLEADERNRNLAYRLAELLEEKTGVTLDVEDNDAGGNAIRFAIDRGVAESFAFRTEDGGLTVAARNSFGLLKGLFSLTDLLTATTGEMTVTAETLGTLADSEGGTTMIRDTSLGILLENKYAYILLTHDGKLLSFLDKSTGDDIAAHDDTPFAVMKADDRDCSVKALSLNGNTLTMTFDEGLSVDLAVNACDDYFTFEVGKELPPSCTALTFVDMKLDYNWNDSDAFVAAGAALTVQTDHVYYPNGEDREVIGRCTAKTGATGAKLGMVAAPKDEQRTILKEMYDAVPKGALPLTQSGGAYALDAEINTGDYVIISSSDPAQVSDWIDFYTQYGVDQLDFHMGNSTFIQGQFTFPVTGSAAAFKEKVADPLAEAGIVSTMHTYSFYIAYNADEILSDPKWQQQLEFLQTFTLASDVSASDTALKTKEDASGLSDAVGFMTRNTPYLLIDQEIISYKVGADGFVSCERGQCGTRAASHKAGASVRTIGGYYSQIAPVPGSELFYEIAHRTAKAYNEGGFRGFYLDAFDSLNKHCDQAGLGEYVWYYEASFVNEIIKYCDTSPMFEYSTIDPYVWSARGRGGAWDTPSRAYKVWNAQHTDSNRGLIDRYYVTTLGWYNFYPTQSGYPGNFSAKYKFFDDVDYLGIQALAYNQTIVYNGLTRSGMDSLPALKRNMDLYQNYSRLRKEGYFSKDFREMLRNPAIEYKLTQQGKLWGFTEASYSRAKLRDAAQDALKDSNPFNAQTPMIRIENMYTSKGGDGITLLELDEDTALEKQKLAAVFSEPIDLRQNLALRVKVKGCGSGSRDAVCIRLSGASLGENGVSDYVIRLNFDGWREFILADVDNGEFTDLHFSGKSDGLYAVYRAYLDYAKVTDIQIYTTGSCDGARMGNIEAVPLDTNKLTDPTVKVGGQSVTFRCTLESGEYLEYLPDEGAVIYDSIGRSRSVDAVDGGVTVGSGDFTATLSGTSELSGAPAEAVLTFGFYGEFIG